MAEIELHISSRLKTVLPPLDDERRKQLEKNIIADGRVIDAILYWWDGKRNVVVDGMHRLPFARRRNIPYRTEAIKIGKTYEEAEAWMWDHQSGRRNLSREVIGKWYNSLKTSRGGDHRSKVANDGLVDAATRIASKTGVSPATVERAGARVEALEKCTTSVQKGVNSRAFKVSDAEIKILSSLNAVNQDNIANDLRKGQAKNVSEAIKKRKIKAPAGKKRKPPAAKPDYGKCPNCAGSKWTEHEDGVICAKCHQPHGEPAGDADEDRVKTQGQKTVKTAEALMRAFDDLQVMLAKPEYNDVITICKQLVETAKGWK